MMFDLEQGDHISITVGIREKLDPEVVNRLLDSIMSIKQQTKLDYLQVFEFASKSPSELTTVTHKQKWKVLNNLVWDFFNLWIYLFGV